MTEREYKIMVGVLLVTNVICLICICLLVGEVNSLQLKLSDMADTIRSFNDKMTRIEGAQEKTLYSEKVIEKGNGYILGGAITMMALIALIYFRGIDPGSLGSDLNLSADQSTMDIEAQNNLISENFKRCLGSIDFMNRGILTEITSRTDQICSKIDIVLNSIIKKDVNLNSILSNTTSSREDWE